ncbi:MAG: hypothetical protein QNJ02_05795 [Desulfobacterales bacterium]|nr:hypothetical protein [Desulfobacterales bacterium]MDJ0874761.1 hypothetical protein [Desulfobacterales bacterium]
MGLTVLPAIEKNAMVTACCLTFLTGPSTFDQRHELQGGMQGVAASNVDAAEQRNAAVTIARSAFVAARKRLFLVDGCAGI